MIPLMAAALYGLAGYQNNENRKREDERQAKMDKIVTDRADRENAEYNKKTNFEAQLADAGKPVAAEQPNDVLKDDDGNDMPALPAFRAGTQRFSSMAEAQDAANKANTPEAVSARQAQVYNANGKPLEALQMGNAVMDAKLKKLGLSSAEAKVADEVFNRKLVADIDANPDWTAGAAKVLTDTQVGGLKGVTVTARPSQDGKTVDFVGVGADGVQKVLKTFNNGPAGRLEFLQTAQKAPIETKLNHLVERMRVEKEDAKTAKEDSRWQMDFDFKKKKEENDQQYRSRVLGLQASQDQRAAETHKLAMEDAKVPAAVKLQAASLAKEMESVSSAMNKAMADNSFDPNSPNAKALIERQAMLGIKYRQLLEPHMPAGKGKPAAADPLGFGKPAANAAPAGAQAAPVVAATAPAAQARPIAVDPNVQVQQAIEQAQTYFRDAGARKALFNKDPEVLTLRQSHSDALRAGKAVQANNIMAQIKQIEQQRYGPQ